MLCMGQIMASERKSKYSIDYPFEVKFQCVEFGSSHATVMITTDSKKEIEIDGVCVNSQEYCVEYNNTRVNEIDKLIVSKKYPLELKIYFEGNELKRDFCFLEFFSSNPDFLKNRISLHINTYEILAKEMREGTVELEISDSSTDSVFIRFPYGGTISSATVWRNDKRTPENVAGQLGGYEIGGEHNYMVWSKDDLGEFSAHFGSCHWYADFKLILK